MNKDFFLKTALFFFFITAGFSQLEVFGIKLGNISVLYLFLGLFLSKSIRFDLLLLFFIVNFLYAWLLGGLSQPNIFLSNCIIFIMMFSLKDLFTKIEIKKIHRYLIYFSYSIFFSNIIALLIMFFIPELKSEVVSLSSLGIRFKGFFGQSNGLAFIMVISMPITLYLFNKNKNIFNIINLFISMISLFLTQSRGGIAALLVSFFILYFIYFLRFGKIREIFISTSIFFIIGFVTLSLVPDFLESRFDINLARFNFTNEYSDSHERHLSDISLLGFIDERAPLLNAGTFTLSKYMFGLGYQDHHIVIGYLTDIYKTPHNYFLSLMLKYGLFLGLIWIYIIFSIIKSGILLVLYKKIDSSNPLFYLLLMILSVSFFYFTHSSEWSYLYVLVSLYLALLNRKNKLENSN